MLDKVLDRHHVCFRLHDLSDSFVAVGDGRQSLQGQKQINFAPSADE